MERTIRARAGPSCWYIRKRLHRSLKTRIFPIHQVHCLVRLLQGVWRGNQDQYFEHEEHIRTSTLPRVTAHHPDRGRLASEALLLSQLVRVPQLWLTSAPLPGLQHRGRNYRQQIL